MSLTACRECGQPVSTEAESCPHCGISQPAPVAMPSAPPFTETDAAPATKGRRRPIWIAVAAAAAIVIGGFFIGQNQGWFPTGSLDSSQVTTVIADRYTQISGQTIDVTCPAIPKQKGRISDCTATVAGTGQSTTVFVKQVDGAGHFTFQPADASILVATLAPSTPGATDTAPAAPELSAEDAGKQNDKGWVLQSFKAKIDEYDDLTAVTRVTNRNPTTSTAFFTITLNRSGAIIATLHGVVNSVAPGQTVTVDFTSTDHIDTKAFTYQFQADTSFSG